MGLLLGQFLVWGRRQLYRQTVECRRQGDLAAQAAVRADGYGREGEHALLFSIWRPHLCRESPAGHARIERQVEFIDQRRRLPGPTRVSF
jgi:hypothetical protein